MVSKFVFRALNSRVMSADIPAYKKSTCGEEFGEFGDCSLFIIKTSLKERVN